MVLTYLMLLECSKKGCKLLLYESLPPPPATWGGGFWHLSGLLLLSLEPQVLDFSDDVLAHLLVLSDFSLALPTGFCPKVVQGVEL